MPFGGTVSADDYDTGTRAAAIGGTTTIVDFAIQATRHTHARRHSTPGAKKAEGKACIDYGLHMIVTDLGPTTHGLDDMDEMVREGIASFKLFMAYPNVLMVDDATIFKAMQQTAKNGALVCMHAENGTVIDIIVQQALAEGKTAPLYHALTRPHDRRGRGGASRHRHGEMAGTPSLHRASLQRRRVERGARGARPRPARLGRDLPAVSGALDRRRDARQPSFEDAKYVFTPPLREKKNQPKLWDGLVHDHLQVVSTDHCPFCFADQKQLGKDDFTKIPNGGPGVENRMQLLFHHGVNAGRITLERFVEITSAAPARIFGMYPKKGVIAAGADADIVLWNPTAEHLISAATHSMHSDYSMFEGLEGEGQRTKSILTR